MQIDITNDNTPQGIPGTPLTALPIELTALPIEFRRSIDLAAGSTGAFAGEFAGGFTGGFEGSTGGFTGGSTGRFTAAFGVVAGVEVGVGGSELFAPPSAADPESLEINFPTSGSSFLTRFSLFRIFIPRLCGSVATSEIKLDMPPIGAPSERVTAPSLQGAGTSGESPTGAANAESDDDDDADTANDARSKEELDGSFMTMYEVANSA